MLHLETVEPRTFSVLKKLMQVPELQDFCLVGGTALSLLYGHRISVDLDLFTNEKFENESIIKAMINLFGEEFIVEEKASSWGIFCFVGDIKIDIIRFSHPIIRPTTTVDGIRMYSVEDIMAMKIQAILGRGKKKDFWDIAELLKHYTIDDFIQSHKAKYRTQNLLISVPQAMTYFDDAEESENPLCLKGQTWEGIKKGIQAHVRSYLQ
jgi:predicted nucleotidyltransferase component of viral defense system